MILKLILILISTEVRGRTISAPYCKDIQKNDRYLGLGIYRHYEDQFTSSSIVLYRKDIEFVVDLFEDMTLKFSKRRRRVSTALYMFSYYRMKYQQSGFFNCEVFSENKGQFETKCQWPSSDPNVFPFKSSTIEYPESAIFVNPSRNGSLLVFDRNNRNRYWSLNLDTKVINCERGSVVRCERPKFIDQLNDKLFSKMEGVLRVRKAYRRGYLLLFNLYGRPKYCFTHETILSEECKSYAKMKTLFAADECFQTPNPLENSEPMEEPTTATKTAKPSRLSSHSSDEVLTTKSQSIVTETSAFSTHKSVLTERHESVLTERYESSTTDKEKTEIQTSVTKVATETLTTESPKIATKTIGIQTSIRHPIESSTNSEMDSNQTNEKSINPLTWVFIAVIIVIVIAIIGSIVAWVFISQKKNAVQKGHQESQPESGSRRRFVLKNRRQRVI